jgi:uncharacterized protein (TIGR00369 family)
MTAQATERTRVVSWQDPMDTARAAFAMSGVELLEAMLAGTVPPPPVALLVGMELLEVARGRVVFGFTPGEHLYNPIGAVAGGVTALVMDGALGCAVHTALPDGSAYTTAEFSINLVRAITVDTGPLRCEATVLHAGRRAATAEAKVVDAEGRLYAHGSTTCVVFPVGGSG